MNLYDFAQLFALLGIATFAISAWILLQIGVGRSPGGISALSNKKYKQSLLNDYKDKKIIAGGPLGLIVVMLKLGLVSLALGGVLWALYQIYKIL